MVKKISVSLPEEVFEALDNFAKEEGVSRSKVIAEALRAYIGRYLMEKEGVRKYPTVLWKLKLSGALRLRSPRRVGRRIKGEWVVEEI